MDDPFREVLLDAGTASPSLLSAQREPARAAALGEIQNSTQAPKCNSCRLLAPVLVRAAQKAVPAFPSYVRCSQCPQLLGNAPRGAVGSGAFSCPPALGGLRSLPASSARNQVGLLSGRPSGPDFPGMM